MDQATSTLLTHCGARAISREQLDAIGAPPPTRTWFPVRHADAIDSVASALSDAGFAIRRVQFAVSRGNARLFSTMDLTARLACGVSLAVGVRNSTDKSFPLGFCAGSRVFVCDNLAFRSELMVRRKHTRFGREQFEREIRGAVSTLEQFRRAEEVRIARLQAVEVTDQAAESWMLRGFERGIVSTRELPALIRGWREPAHEEFRPRTLWSLFNAFTGALGPGRLANPQRFAARSIRLSVLLDPGPHDAATALERPEPGSAAAGAEPQQPDEGRHVSAAASSLEAAVA
jgi:hypothetical protein